jgi:Domain of unknown function (DUF3846)
MPVAGRPNQGTNHEPGTLRATSGSPPIRALIIQPDSTYEVREIAQGIQTLQGLVGGYLEAWSSEHCVFWFNEEGKLKDLPTNAMATYLWWKICPEIAERDLLRGPVFVTGPHDEAGDSLPVSDDVIDLFERLEKIRAEEEGA